MSEKEKEQINPFNLFKSQEIYEKVSEPSHIHSKGINPNLDLFTNFKINSTLSNEWNSAKFPKFLVDLTNESKKSYPIDNYYNSSPIIPP